VHGPAQSLDPETRTNPNPDYTNPNTNPNPNPNPGRVLGFGPRRHRQYLFSGNV